MRKKLSLLLLLLLIPTLAYAWGIMIIGGGVPVTGTWSTVWLASNECTGAEANLETAGKIRNVVLAATTTGGGSKIRLTFKARDDASINNFDAVCVYIGPRSGGDVMTGTTEITFNTGSSGFSLTTNSETIVSDEITFAFSTAQDYLVQVENNANIYARRWNDDGDTECLDYYEYGTTEVCTDTLDFDSDGADAYVVGLQKIEAFY